MSDARKSREPGVSSARPPRDPRVDSTPPARLDETPLPDLAHVAHVFSRPTAAPLSERRLASLEAEVERLRTGRETDADDAAGMLVRIAESERARLTAELLAIDAGAKTGLLEEEVERARDRIDELEREVAGLHEQWSLAETRLSAARENMAVALGFVEEIERREEMTASLRARTLRDALRSLRGEPNHTAAPESSVEPLGSHDVEWELDVAK